MNPSFISSKGLAAWHKVGLVSDFPNISPDAESITTTCKSFKVPRFPDEPLQETDIDLPGDLKDQVLVFRYNDTLHAIDHQCPHSSFPLSQGTLFDIEDFGLKLSAGITCPKHGWAFDIISGKADRGNYKLKVWEVQLRDIPGSESDDKEVWVRRKQRIG